MVLGGGGSERLGAAQELWFTGDTAIPVMSGWRYGQFARKITIAAGVPPESLRLLESTSRWEDGEQIELLAQSQSVCSILVIMDWYHSRRALAVLRRHLQGTDVRVVYQPTRGLTNSLDNWWRTERGVVPSRMN